MANAIRFLSVEMIEKAKSGHPGMPLGIADIATMLFAKHIKVNPKNPRWFDRDRFVLSAGHASSLLYSVFYLMGYKDIDKEDLMNFRQLGAKTAGHPEYGHLEGIDMTTGPLGQGISSAVGMALAEKIISAKYGSDVCDHYTYVIMGDGCLMEGISEEAISLAGHLKLNKLIALWDNNNVTIDGHVDVASSTNQVARFKANGWNTIEIDGHNFCQIDEALKKAKKSDKPTMIACKTTIGFGAPTKCNSPKCHGAPLGADELAAMRQKLGWTAEPFEVPEEILNDWRAAGKRSEASDKDWQKRAKAKGKEFLDIIEGKLPKGWDKELNKMKAQAAKDKVAVASRKASQMCLEAIMPYVPQLVGGSADLAGPNMIMTKTTKTITAKDYNGNNIEYGVREHAMGAMMNGMALHGGILPFGGTFFVFSDYLRPSMRLAALMGLHTIYVMTHDSIGVGEDGPTHQPIEQLASFRAMPNILTFRPCDVVETAEAWALAIEQTSTPSILALSRQTLPALREETKHNLSARGAYIIAGDAKKRQATLIATGSEVGLAVEARNKLKEDGIEVAVVSMPCAELFDKQDILYQEEILGTAPRIAVEAASKFGWEKYVGLKGDIIGMDGFGASAPGAELYKYFGITVEEVVDAVKDSLK
ncbi:MAG: transketolase [bacterium]|nr:transketolase [bacterium]MDY2830767.1 transketolase [Alphaproteobacteria bacterium]